jgi:hypothetical protein
VNKYCLLLLFVFQSSWATTQELSCIDELTTAESNERRLAADFYDLVAELKENNLPELHQAVHNPRVAVRFRPSKRPFHIKWTYGFIRNQYTITVSGKIDPGKRESALWGTARELFKMRNYQGLLQRSRPLWQKEKFRFSHPMVNRGEMSETDIVYAMAARPELQLENILKTYPKARADAVLEDRAAMGAKMYALYKKLSTTTTEKLPLPKNDPARFPKFGLFTSWIYLWAGSYANLHDVNASDLALNADAATLREHLRKRFGWRLFTNWHEMLITRALLFGTLLMLPTHISQIRNFDFQKYSHAGERLPEAVNRNYDRDTVNEAKDILAQYDDPESTPQDREDALEALDELYKANSFALRKSRAESLVLELRSRNERKQD